MNVKATSPEDKVGLPLFAYHPDPLATGSVRMGEGRCACCGRERGYVYTASIYGSAAGAALCPWCIADGSAAAKFDVTFSDDQPLLEAGVTDAIIEEVTQRTPGYHSLQQEEWLSCCGDACEYHGRPAREQVALLDPTAVARFLAATGWPPEKWLEFAAGYEPAGRPVLHHFVCRGCREANYGCDGE